MEPAGRRSTAVALACVLFLLAQVHVATQPVALPVLLLGLAAAALRGELDLDRRVGRVEWAFLAFAVAWVAASLLGRDPARSLALSPPLAVAGLLGVALGRSQAAALRAAWGALLVACTAQAALVLGAWAAGVRGAQAMVDAASAGWLVVPNDLAVVAALWPLWWSQQQGGRARVACAAAFLVQAAALLALSSRLGVLLVACALAWLAWTRAGRGARLVLGAGALLAACAVLALGKGSAGIAARLQLWQAAWQLFQDAPASGVGPHNFVHAYLPAMADVVLDPRLTPWPHNLPLELAVSGGVLLLLPAAALVACALQATCRRGAATVATGGMVLLLCLLEASTLRVWLWVIAGLWIASANRRHASPGELPSCSQPHTAASPAPPSSARSA